MWECSIPVKSNTNLKFKMSPVPPYISGQSWVSYSLKGSYRKKTLQVHLYFVTFLKLENIRQQNPPALLWSYFFFPVSNDRPSIYRHLLLYQHTGTRLVMTLGVDWTRWALSAWLAASCPFVLKHCAEWGGDTLSMPHLLRLWLPHWVS